MSNVERPRASIIIPIYNAEDTISRCLDSVFAQTYPDFEVICIDDGSTDGSLLLLKSYQEVHSNLKVIHQENQGVSAARNLGIEQATGKYITFVDGDDKIKEDFIQELVSRIGANDVVVSGYERLDSDGGCLFSKSVPSNSAWAMYKFSSTCGKLYRRSFLVEHRIRYPHQYKIGEDMFFSLVVLSHTDKIKSTPYVGYINYSNPSSVTHQNNTTKKNRNIKMLALLKDIEITTEDSSKIPVNYRLFFYLKTIILHLLTQRYLLSDAEFYQEYQTYFAWLEKIYRKYNHKMHFYCQDGEELKVNMICNIFILAIKTHTMKILLFLLNHLHVAKIE